MHGLQVRRTANQLARYPAGLFQQHVELSSNAAPIEVALMTVDARLQPGEPVGLDLFRDLIAAIGRRCPGPWRIFERKRVRVAYFVDEAQRFAEILFGFAGEADDEIRRERD